MARKTTETKKRAGASDSAEPSYVIDQAALTKMSKSYQVMLYSRLCKSGSCQMCGDGSDQFGYANLPRSRDMQRAIKSHCMKQENFLPSNAPLLEIVFLALVANNNSPLPVSAIVERASEVWADNLYLKNRSEANIIRMLDTPNSHGIVRATAKS